MAIPSHLPYVARGLTDLPHEDIPLRGVTEDEYFRRVMADIRHHARAERRRRVIAWLGARDLRH